MMKLILNQDVPGLGAPGDATLQQRVERVVDRAVGVRHQVAGQADQVLVHQVADQPDATVGAQGVGAGVLDVAVRIETDEAVADPGRVGVVAALARLREVAGRDHLGEVARGLEVGELEAARGADAEQVGVASHQGDDPA